MVLPELSIRRPVLATVMSLIVVLLGIIAYDRLHGPRVSEHRRAGGHGRDQLQGRLGRHRRDPGHADRSRSRLAGIEGIEYMSSISRPERSQITVRFRLTRDPDGAANDVRDRVGRARGQLPDEIDEPIVAKVEADAQPIIYLAFSSDRHSPMEVTDYADRFVKDRLQNLPGVADVRIFGERRYSMRIWLDRARLAAYRLTPQDVEDALRRQNVEIPAGRVESVAREFTVVTETDLRTPEQFEQTSSCARRRLPGAPRRRRPGRAGARGRARQRPLQGPQRRRARHRQAGDRQPARHLRGRARRAAGASRPTCPKACGSTSPTTARSSSGNRSTRCSRPSARRWCWWCS